MHDAECCDQLSVSGVRYSQRAVEVEPGVSLKVMSWEPEGPCTADPVLFIAGWVSVIEGWAPVLEAMAPSRRVVYVETREKRSAVIAPGKHRPASFAIPRIAEDLAVICDALEMDPQRSVLFASSLGANAVLEGLKGSRLRCRAAFLIGPNIEFHFPLWGRALTYMPSPCYHVAKHPILWYLRRYRVNARDDPKQMARYVRTLNAAHPLRLKLSARAVLDYSIWDGLDTIAAPVAIAYAANDTLHGTDEILSIVDTIAEGRAVQCPSNTYMHEATIVADLDSYLGGLP